MSRSIKQATGSKNLNIFEGGRMVKRIDGFNSGLRIIENFEASALSFEPSAFPNSPLERASFFVQDPLLARSSEV
jgi:hypothetical protein